MKTSSLILSSLATLVLVAATAALSAPVKSSIFRKFKGRYEGPVRGVYGESTGGLLNLNPISYTRNTKVSSKRRVNFVSPTDQVHRITWRRPTGNRRKIKMVGIYSGQSYNPFKGVNEPVSGYRRQTIVDRGRNKPRRRRFVMRLNRDILQEGSLSYLRVSGKLARQ